MATPMELETEEDKYLSVWDELGKHLDNDMPPEDLQQAMQLLRGKLSSDFQTELPSDVLRFLQNNYPQGRALSIMKHVLRIMDSHHQGKTTWSHASLFEEYENKLKAFGKNETFVGRQEELNEILGMFSLSSEIKGFWIYGHGGMGKSTLANEVSWHICSTTDTELIQLNLSETSNFTDMLMDLKRGIGCYLSTESESNLVDETLNHVTNIKQDTLILFDNIEEVYFHNKEKLESFISKLMKRLKSSKFKAFEAGIFVSSEPSSADEDSSRSSSSSNSSDDIDRSHRKDSGMAGSDSDMDVEYTVGINTVEQPSMSENDSVFEGQDDDFLRTSSTYKRKLSD